MDEDELATLYLANVAGPTVSLDMTNAALGLSLEIHCPHCGLPYDEMPTGHTWRTDGSDCWDEPEEDDE